MNKSQVVDAVAAHSGLTKKDTLKVIDCLLSVILHTLEKKEEVSFPGFGRFKVSTRAARDGRNPKTGEKIRITARSVVRFNAGSDLQKIINP